jgi:acylglycerol lipase
MATTIESSGTETIQGDAGGLFLRWWRPQSVPTALVVICHGFNAHSGHVEWAAQQFVAQGYAVYAGDLRGRGHSEGERFLVEEIGDYVGDLRNFVRTAMEREPNLPVFLLGHSAGGVISACYTLEFQDELAGFICESFAFQVPAPGFVLKAVEGLSHVAPHLGVLTLHNKDFSRDPAWVALMDADPLIKDETQPAITVAALARADEMLHESFPQITIPLLILHGTEDHATVYHGSEFFHKTAGSADKTLKLYEGHFHDLLADTGKEQVMADIVTWIETRRN